MDTANLTPVRLINWIFSGKTSEHTSLVPESKEITHDKLINEAGTQIILNGMTPKSFTNSI